MKIRFEHPRWPLSDQFRQSSGMQDRIFFTVCCLFFLYFSGNFSDLLDNDAEAWSVNPNLFAPEFQGGRLTRNYEASKAMYEQAFAQYHQAALNGYREVLNADQELFNQQIQLAQTEGDELRAHVELYRALGGGWQY